MAESGKDDEKLRDFGVSSFQMNPYNFYCPCLFIFKLVEGCGRSASISITGEEFMGMLDRYRPFIYIYIYIHTNTLT